MSNMQTVWREGGRIRRTDGIGYGDSVSDDKIRAHMDTASAAGDEQFVVFAMAVLAIRAVERLSMGGEGWQLADTADNR